MLVLLWGPDTDQPLAALYKELQQLGIAVLLVNQRDILAINVQLQVAAEISGIIHTKEQQTDLQAVTAAYLRPYDSRYLSAVAQAGPTSVIWQHAQAVDDTLWAWTEITPARVVNRLRATATNGSKPYQLEIIRRIGFSVPDTLITTDPQVAMAFWEQHKTIIYKSISGIRSIVRQCATEHRERLNDVTHCPTQFQQYVTGRDHRVHVVGNEIFASEVITEADDYRYANGLPVEIRACQLPEGVADRCRQLAATLDLPVAGIDLRQTPDGEWYCFEVNPSPAFTYYQEKTGQPIGAAIARLLVADT